MASETMAAPVLIRVPQHSNTLEPSTDSQLLQIFLSGTGDSAEAAFAALVQRHGEIVHRVCLDVLGNRDEAQDVAQAVFLVLARRAVNSQAGVTRSLVAWGCNSHRSTCKARGGSTKGRGTPKSRKHSRRRSKQMRAPNHGL